MVGNGTRHIRRSATQIERGKILDTVRRSPLLRGLEEDTLGELLAGSHLRRWERGEPILREAFATDLLHVLVAGTAKIHHFTAEGNEVITGLRTQGDLVGEVCVISGVAAPHGATAVTPLEAIVMPGRHVRQLMGRSSRLATALARQLAVRVRSAEAAQVSLSSTDAFTRVVRQIIALVEGWGERVGTTIDIDLPLTQEELSSWAGVSRETTTKVLRVLRDADVLTTSRCHLTILDETELYRWVEDRPTERTLDLTAFAISG